MACLAASFPFGSEPSAQAFNVVVIGVESFPSFALVTFFRGSPCVLFKKKREESEMWMRELSTTIQTTIDSDDERKRTRARTFCTERRETSKNRIPIYIFDAEERRRKDAYPTTATERCQSAEEPAAASVGG